MLSGVWEDEGHLLKVLWHGREIAQLRVRREDWAVGAFFPEPILRWFPPPAEGTVELPPFSPWGPIGEPLPNTYFRGDFFGDSTALLGDRQGSAESIFTVLFRRAMGALRRAAPTDKHAATLLLVAGASPDFQGGEVRTEIPPSLTPPPPEATKEEALAFLLQSLLDMGFKPEAQLGGILGLTRS